MKFSVEDFRDPETGSPLTLKGDVLYGEQGRTFPIVNGIPRFVPEENYASGFGDQWNRFPKTQLDSHSGLSVTEDRLRRCLSGHLSRLNGKKVLEAGAGAGRFTEILLKHGAIVHSFDYSSAVDANALNNGDQERLCLVQADIRKIPFVRSAYDYVICLGVLQHTPNPEESIASLWRMVKPGGHLVIDHYRYRWKFLMPPPIGSAGMLYRLFTLKILPRKYWYRFVCAVTDFWFPVHWLFKDSLLAQRVIRRLSPVHFYYPDLKLRDRQMYYEWAVLDTHDSTTDFYKHHRRPEEIHATLTRIGAAEVDVRVGGNGVEAFCTKPLQ